MIIMGEDKELTKNMATPVPGNLMIFFDTLPQWSIISTRRGRKVPFWSAAK
jgi:hypothetical protein